MLYLALAELVVIVLTIYVSYGLLRSQSRANARREDILLDKALHAAGRPWTPAPADERPEIDWDEVLAPRGFTATPEQEP